MKRFFVEPLSSLFGIVLLLGTLSGCVAAASNQERQSGPGRQEAQLFEKNADPNRKSAVRQLRPLMRKGEPIFPVGAYSFPHGMVENWKTLREGGWNTIVAHEKRYDTPEEGLELLRAAEGEDVAIIVSAHDLTRDRKMEAFTRYIQKAKTYDSFWGIYLMDEPENIFWSNDKSQFAGNQYDAWMRRRGMDPEDDKKRSQNLDAFLIERLTSYKNAFDQLVPDEDRYVFTLLAWTNFYSRLASITDVNMPNTYSIWNEETQRGEDVAKVVWDARKAAQTAEEHGRRPFIWTPLALDNWSRRQPQILFRHDAFAAITQGAMGIVYWAAYRNSEQYAKEVVFPVTRELQQLSPFFLGEWMDEKLRWTPQDRGTDELEKYDVPRVSACLRRGPDGTYLLLAVNNTAEPTQAHFTADIEGLAPRATEMIEDDESVQVTERNEISDELGPYAVKAYVLERR